MNDKISARPVRADDLRRDLKAGKYWVIVPADDSGAERLQAICQRLKRPDRQGHVFRLPQFCIPVVVFIVAKTQVGSLELVEAVNGSRPSTWQPLITAQQLESTDFLFLARENEVATMYAAWVKRWLDG